MYKNSEQKALFQKFTIQWHTPNRVDIARSIGRSPLEGVALGIVVSMLVFETLVSFSPQPFDGTGCVDIDVVCDDRIDYQDCMYLFPLFWLLIEWRDRVSGPASLKAVLYIIWTWRRDPRTREFPTLDPFVRRRKFSIMTLYCLSCLRQWDRFDMWFRPTEDFRPSRFCQCCRNDFLMKLSTPW